MLLARTDKQKDGGYLEKWWRDKILCVDDMDGITNRMKEHNIKFDKNCFYVDGEIFCYCEAISMSQKVKDEGAYKRCTRIILDEAVQPGEHIMIVNKRPMMARVFEIWQTVARGWENALDVTCLIFLANTSSRDNWVFRDLRINDFVRPDTKYTVQDGIVVQIVNNKIAAKNVAKSHMGQIMRRSESGKEYYESAQNNAFNDNTAFIKPIGLDFKKLRIQIVYMGDVIGVFGTDNGIHVAKIERDSRSAVICNDIKYHDENTNYMENADLYRTFAEMYRKGKVTFGSLESKNLFLAFLGFYINY